MNLQEETFSAYMRMKSIYILLKKLNIINGQIQKSEEQLYNRCLQICQSEEVASTSNPP